MTEIKTLGLAGAGVIGAGWAARALYHGLKVVVYDPSPQAQTSLQETVLTAWPSLTALNGDKGFPAANLSFTSVLKEMAQAADWIQESAPEREGLKITLLADIDRYADPQTIIASSSSGFLPTNLQAKCSHPERLIIAHPFNPVYLLPLVEIVPGKKTSFATVERAEQFYKSIAMHPLILKNEIEGYVCDRLQEALWREALHIVNRGAGTTADVDDAIIYSAGLRWAFMGPFMTYHLAGGQGGMANFLSQFDPELELPWTDLGFPKWSDELEQKLISGCETQAAGKNYRQWEEKRNAVLVDIIKVLEKHGIGAGTVR